jgi:hypothetical protein
VRSIHYLFAVHFSIVSSKLREAVRVQRHFIQFDEFLPKQIVQM